MGTKRVRLTKREMKEDKFTTFMLLAKDYLLDRWIYFASGVVLLLVVIASISYIQSSSSKGDHEAAELMTRATNELGVKNYQLAIINFKTIVDDLGSSSHAQQALFNLGNAYFAAKNFEEAKATFEKYIVKYDDDKYFVTSALAGMAASTAGLGDQPGAARLFLEAAEKYQNFELAGEYYLKAMYYYAKSNNLESARAIFSTLSTDFKDTRYYVEGQRIAGEYKISL